MDISNNPKKKCSYLIEQKNIAIRQKKRWMDEISDLNKQMEQNKCGKKYKQQQQFLSLNTSIDDSMNILKNDEMAEFMDKIKTFNLQKDFIEKKKKITDELNKSMNDFETNQEIENKNFDENLQTEFNKSKYSVKENLAIQEMNTALNLFIKEQKESDKKFEEETKEIKTYINNPLMKAKNIFKFNLDYVMLRIAGKIANDKFKDESKKLDKIMKMSSDEIIDQSNSELEKLVKLQHEAHSKIAEKESAKLVFKHDEHFNRSKMLNDYEKIFDDIKQKEIMSKQLLLSNRLIQTELDANKFADKFRKNIMDEENIEFDKQMKKFNEGLRFKKFRNYVYNVTK
jgi:hypothetical protein